VTRSPDLEAAEQTVASFAGLLGTPLLLKDAKVPCNLDNQLHVPFKDSRLYCLVERQLAHFVFGSDPAAQDAFIEQFISRTADVTGRTKYSARDLSEFRSKLPTIIGILETRRVLSLWELLYEESADQIRQLLRGHLRVDESSLMDAFAALSVDKDRDLAAFERFVPLFREALRRVERRSFAATLVVARWLISQLVQQLHPAGASTEERLTALLDLSILFGEPLTPVQKVFANYGGESGDATIGEEAFEFDTRDTDALEAALAASERRAQDLLRAAHVPTAAPPEPLSEPTTFITRTVDIHVDGPSLLAYAADPADTLAARQIQQELLRLGQRKRVALDEVGVELDTSALLERLVGGSAVPCFRQDGRTREVHAVLLVDRSTSMLFDNRVVEAERAVRVLVRALRVPGVRFQVWGFQAPEDGVVAITRFHSARPSLHTKTSPVLGGTPLHVAIDLAVDDLEPLSGSRYIFCVTDGAPDFAGVAGYKPRPQLLRSAVRARIDRAARAGMGFLSLILGSPSETGSVAYEVSVDEADEIFGDRSRYRFVPCSTLMRSLVEAVASSVRQHVRLG